MIVGLGIDIAEVGRVRDAIERYGQRFLDRVYTPSEIAYCQTYKDPYERYAARFAAKEAAMKALGTGWRRGVAWRDLEVVRHPGGKPSMHFTGEAAQLLKRMKVTNVVLSITHTSGQAMAQVIFESD